MVTARSSCPYLKNDIAVAKTDQDKFILQFGHRLPRIRSMNLRLQQYLNQVLTWCDRWRIKLNPGKTRLLNFSQRKVISDT